MYISLGPPFIIRNFPLKNLIEYAFNVQNFQIKEGPASILSEHFDIRAKLDTSAHVNPNMSDEEQGSFLKEQRRRVQNLLADRFQLRLHRETRELPVYALMAAKNGPKLHESAVTDGPNAPSSTRIGPGRFSGRRIKPSSLAEALSNQLGRTVIDRTGLNGFYDFTLKWMPDESSERMFKESSGPSLFTAIQEQLGLKLEPSKGPVEILVIDHVEQPSEN